MADEIPTDDEVVAAVGNGAVKPSTVLQMLMERGHGRAASQRAMQRALDRDKIAFNTELKFVAVRIPIDA